MSYMFQGYLASGQILENRGEFEKAKQKYELAIKEEPNAIVGHIRLGDIYQKLGKNDLAETEFKLAVNIDPDNPNILHAHAHKRLASLYQRQSDNELKKLGQAIQEYEASVKLNPTDHDSYYMIASLYGRVGLVSHAENAIQSAININPKSGKILCTGAVVYEQIGLIDKAKEAFKTAVKVNPSEVDNDCRYAAELGKYGGQALDDLCDALKKPNPINVDEVHA